MTFFKEKFNDFRAKYHSIGLDDPRLLGLIVLAVIGLSVIWNGARVVQQNYLLLQKIAILQEENRVIEIENKNKEIQNEYYKTAEFAELKARRVNGKAAPGESVYIVTNEVALASLKTPEKTTEEKIEKPAEKPKYQKNFEAWIDFFFGNN
ncbi:MAG: hypothetical protein Q7T41_03640 [Candidatus Saccharibacteria bacterium]|nr:hypothetical protein [Candidatus Saccharibacteria bacterium]